MKKVVEVEMFSKDDVKLMNRVLETKVVKGLAGIKKLDELEYDCDAMVRLDENIIKIVSKLKNEYIKVKNSNIDYINILKNYDKVDYIIVYNDFSDYIEKYNID